MKILPYIKFNKYFPKKYKFPRKKKKQFKKYLSKISYKSTTIHPNAEKEGTNKLIIPSLKGIYNVYMMKKYNLKNYKGTREIFRDESKF